MKRSFLLAFTLLYSGFLWAQNFSSDYFSFRKSAFEEKMMSWYGDKDKERDSISMAQTGKHLWESEEMDPELKSYLDQILIYKRVLRLKGIEIDSLNNFVVIEEFNFAYVDTMAYMSGVIVLDKQNISYRYSWGDTSSVSLNTAFLENYATLDKKNPKSIVYHLVKEQRYAEIEQLGKIENEPENMVDLFEKEFSIIVYNKQAKERIRNFKLHETVVNFFKG